MIKFISFFFDRIFVIAGAIIFSQIPTYFTHYTQRLGGHASELKMQMDAMQQAALKSGKTLPEFIHKFQSHADSDISLQGAIMKEMMTRYVDITSAYTSLVDATSLSKPFIFMKSFDWNIAKTTLNDFSPGLTFSIEGAIYAFFGLIFGYVLYSTLRLIVRRTLQHD